MEKIKKYFFDVLFVITALFFLAICVWKIRMLSYENSKLKAQLESAENDIQSLEEKEEIVGKLKLKCDGKTLNFGAVNGVKKEALPSLEVNSPYPITLYQVIGKQEGKEERVLQNSAFEGKDAKIKNFKLEGVTEEVTEIRLFGFDTNGDQVTSQTYEIVFLE